MILDDAAVKPYTAIDSVHADPVDPMPVIDPAILLDDFTDEAAERLLAVAGHGSGSPADPGRGAHSWAAPTPGRRRTRTRSRHRSAGFSLLAVGMADDARRRSTREQLFAAMAEWDTGGIWPNFGPADDERTARRAYDEETLRRIVDVASHATTRTASCRSAASPGWFASRWPPVDENPRPPHRRMRPSQ